MILLKSMWRNWNCSTFAMFRICSLLESTYWCKKRTQRDQKHVDEVATPMHIITNWLLSVPCGGLVGVLQESCSPPTWPLLSLHSGGQGPFGKMTLTGFRPWIWPKRESPFDDLCVCVCWGLSKKPKTKCRRSAHSISYFWIQNDRFSAPFEGLIKQWFAILWYVCCR